MGDDIHEILRSTLRDGNYEKLMALANPKLHRFVADAVELCRPDSVFVTTDAPDDIAYIRQCALDWGEEKALATAGHTIHFDGYWTASRNDQGRDKGNTKYLLPPGMDLGAKINSTDRDAGLVEVKGLLRDSMRGRQALLRFFCLGPVNSDFSISGVQITDSAYVGHSEDLLYRPGYEQFKRLGASPDFFLVLHSAGELENGVSKNVDERRVYIDLRDETVYSVNTQYAGNTVGFKKLALRVAIRRADREGWLAEHMFIMGAHGPGGRVTYFAGAYPSACGKTSTSMMEGHTIIGDDLAYIRVRNGRAMTVNVECGIFGIIENVNPKDDPLLWEVLTHPGEAIFSNVLVADGKPCWLGDGRQMPERGVNFAGKWHRDQKDSEGVEIPLAHKNARYTIRLAPLKNLDPHADDPEGVPIGGIIYGGRDSDTSVPLLQSLDWAHGVVTMGASLESETTAATLGKMGVRVFQPMSIMDFLSVPLGKYIQNHLDMARTVAKPPMIFGVNYFIKGSDGRYLNGMSDKNVWLHWMELRVHGEVEAVRTPAGLIPCYEDLKRLFRQVLNDDYTQEQYAEQFKLRIPENLAKIERIEKIYREQVRDTPSLVLTTLAEQRRRLLTAQQQHGDYVSPLAFVD